VVATFFTFAFPVLMVLLFGSMYGNAPEHAAGGVGAMDRAVVGYAVALVIGASAFVGLPVEVAARRQNGVLRRFRVTPLSPAAVIASQIVVTVVVCAAGIVVLATAGFLVWGARPPSDLLALIPAFLLCASSLSALGMLVAGAARSVKASLAVSIALFYPMIFLSDGTIPVQYLPESLQKVAWFLPMSWAVRLLRGVWLGQGWDIAASCVLLGMLVFGGALAALLLRRD
jgi:ABC-2 type transport system permease protein